MSGRKGGGTGKIRDRPNGNNQHGNLVKNMPATYCDECRLDVREGVGPRRARSFICPVCDRVCWSIDHPSLGYVKGALP